MPRSEESFLFETQEEPFLDRPLSVSDDDVADNASALAPTSSAQASPALGQGHDEQERQKTRCNPLGDDDALSPTPSTQDFLQRGTFVFGEFKGRGATADVYEIWTRDNERFAVKVCPLRLPAELQQELVNRSSRGDTTDLEKQVRRQYRFFRERQLQREVELLRMFSRQNYFSTAGRAVHVIRFFGSTLLGDAFYIFLECAETDLQRYWQSFLKDEDAADDPSSQHGMPLEVVLECYLQMTKAVATVHAANVIHFDLKPSNFLLVREGGNEKANAVAPYRLVLSDFGIAERATVRGRSRTAAEKRRRKNRVPRADAVYDSCDVRYGSSDEETGEDYTKKRGTIACNRQHKPERSDAAPPHCTIRRINKSHEQHHHDDERTNDQQDDSHVVERLHSVGGTPHFQAPETLFQPEAGAKRHMVLRPSVDIWSLNIIVYLLVHNKVPTHGIPSQRVPFAINDRRMKICYPDVARFELEVRRLLGKDAAEATMNGTAEVAGTSITARTFLGRLSHLTWLMSNCLQRDPGSRLNAGEILQELKDMAAGRHEGARATQVVFVSTDADDGDAVLCGRSLTSNGGDTMVFAGDGDELDEARRSNGQDGSYGLRYGSLGSSRSSRPVSAPNSVRREQQKQDHATAAVSGAITTVSSAAIFWSSLLVVFIGITVTVAIGVPLMMVYAGQHGCDQEHGDHYVTDGAEVGAPPLFDIGGGGDAFGWTWGAESHCVWSGESWEPPWCAIGVNVASEDDGGLTDMELADKMDADENGSDSEAFLGNRPPAGEVQPKRKKGEARRRVRRKGTMSKRINSQKKSKGCAPSGEENADAAPVCGKGNARPPPNKSEGGSTSPRASHARPVRVRGKDSRRKARLALLPQLWGGERPRWVWRVRRRSSSAPTPGGEMKDDVSSVADDVEEMKNLFDSGAESEETSRSASGEEDEAVPVKRATKAGGSAPATDSAVGGRGAWSAANAPLLAPPSRARLWAHAIPVAATTGTTPPAASGSGEDVNDKSSDESPTRVPEDSEDGAVFGELSDNVSSAAETERE